MSVIKKMSKAQTTSEEFSKALEILHKRLSAKTAGYTSDIKIAKELEIFFNKILFPRKYSKASISGVLANMMKETTAEDIRKKLNLTSGEATKNWQSFENAIGAITSEIVSSVTKNSQSIKNIGGTAQSTVKLNLNDVPKHLQKEVLEALKKSSTQFNEKDYSFQAKFAKNDTLIVTGNSNIDDIFNNFSFTTKNYSGNMKLEMVNIDKAFLAAINSVGGKIKNIYNYYILNSTEKEKFNMHLNHIRNIYALTGLGSEYVNVGEDINNINIFARFLVVRTTGKHEVKVYSTKAIMASALGYRSKTANSVFEASFAYDENAIPKWAEKATWAQKNDNYTYLNLKKR